MYWLWFSSIRPVQTGLHCVIILAEKWIGTDCCALIDPIPMKFNVINPFPFKMGKNWLDNKHIVCYIWLNLSKVYIADCAESYAFSWPASLENSSMHIIMCENSLTLSWLSCDIFPMLFNCTCTSTERPTALCDHFWINPWGVVSQRRDYCMMYLHYMYHIVFAIVL